MRDVLIKSGCLVNSIELLYLEKKTVFREKVLSAFKGKNGIRSEADKTNNLISDDVLGVLDHLLDYVYKANHKRSVSRFILEIIRVFFVSRLPVPFTKRQQQHQRQIQKLQTEPTSKGQKTNGLISRFQGYNLEEGSVYSKQEVFLMQWAETQRNEICDYLHINEIPQLRTKISNFDVDFSDMFVILCILAQFCPYERRLYLALYYHFYYFQIMLQNSSVPLTLRIEQETEKEAEKINDKIKDDTGSGTTTDSSNSSVEGGNKNNKNVSVNRLLMSRQQLVVLGRRSVGVYPTSFDSASPKDKDYDDDREKHFTNMPEKLSESDVNYQLEGELHLRLSTDYNDENMDEEQKIMKRRKEADNMIKEILDSNTEEKVRFLGRTYELADIILHGLKKINFGVILDKNSLILMNSANRIIFLALLYTHLVNIPSKKPSTIKQSENMTNQTTGPGKDLLSQQNFTTIATDNSEEKKIFEKNNMKTLMENCDLIIRMESEIGSTKEQKIVLRTTKRKQQRRGTSPGESENGNIINGRSNVTNNEGGGNSDNSESPQSTYYQVGIHPIYDNDADELINIIRHGAMDKNKKALFKRAAEISLVGTDESGRLLVKNYYEKKDPQKANLKYDETNGRQQQQQQQPNKGLTLEQQQPSIIIRYTPKFSTSIPTLVTLTHISSQETPKMNNIALQKPLMFLILPHCTRIGSTVSCNFTSKLYKPCPVEIHVDNQAHEEALVTLSISRVTDFKEGSTASERNSALEPFAIDCLFLLPQSQKMLSKLNPARSTNILGNKKTPTENNLSLKLDRMEQRGINKQQQQQQQQQLQNNKNSENYEIILPSGGLTLEFIYLPFHLIEERYRVSVIDNIRGVWCKEIILNSDIEGLVHFKSEVNSYCSPHIEQSISIPFNNAVLRRVVQANAGFVSPLVTNVQGGNTTATPRQNNENYSNSSLTNRSRNKNGLFNQNSSIGSSNLALNSSLLLSAMMKEESIQYFVTTDAEFIKCPTTLTLWNTNRLLSPNSSTDLNTAIKRNKGEYTNNTLNFSLKCQEPGVYTGSIILISKYDTRIYNLTANIYDKPNIVNLEIETAVNRLVIQRVPVTGPPNSTMRLELAQNQMEIVDNGMGKLRALFSNASTVQEAGIVKARIEPSETTKDEMCRMIELPNIVQIGPAGRGEFTLKLHPSAMCNFVSRLHIINSLIDTSEPSLFLSDANTTNSSKSRLDNYQNPE